MPDAVLLVTAAVALWLIALALLLLRTPEPRRRPHRSSRPHPAPPSRGGRQPPKPPWVRREVIRLRALMPGAGCRRIAITFNHLHGRRGMTVGKSFVASVLRGAQAEVLRARREIRRHLPRRLPRNLIWALDLTFLPSQALPVLGILDHGSRACLELEKVATRRTVTLLRVLLETIERFGPPKIVRTDNEPVVTSRLFSWTLALLGIRHQRTAPFAPWQNGRIERFFGTFKRTLRARAAVQGLPQEPIGHQDLAEFRAWYNHLRPHQNLDGWTPAEAWPGRELARRGRPRWLSGWGGVLSGPYWPSR